MKSTTRGEIHQVVKFIDSICIDIKILHFKNRFVSLELLLGDAPLLLSIRKHKPRLIDV